MSLRGKFDPQRIAALRDFKGPAQVFWREYAGLLADASETRCLLLLARSAGADAEWKVLTRVPASAETLTPALRRNVRTLADRAADEGFADMLEDDGSAWFVGLQVQVREKHLQMAAVMDLPRMDEQGRSAVAERLLMLADVPKAQAVESEMRRMEESVEQHALALDLLLLLNEQERFGAAALTLANELASRTRSTLVSIGWLEGRYVRLKAVSQMSGFEKKMDAVRLHEAAMEEALDQDDEVVLPAPPESLGVVHQHERLAKEARTPYVLSTPLRIKGRPCAVITLQREDRAFDAVELQVLRIVADQVVRPLSDLYERDRWLGARLKRSAERWMRRQWSLDHPWAKIGAVCGMLALVAIFVIRVPYRIEAPFILRTSEQVLISAPFDGFLKEAPYHTGDSIENGSILLRLDERALRLEEVALVADAQRYRREAELHREEGRFAQMLISEAQERQALSRLEQVRERLVSASVVAPFDGYVVEDSDLFQRIGAPVREGDVLIRFSRLDGLFVDINVAETDVHEVGEGSGGEIAFSSRPEEKFAIRIIRIEPMASTDEKGAIFIVRADLATDAAAWWRPGMTGLAKIDAGERSLFWIFTHRLFDWLRLKLWW